MSKPISIKAEISIKYLSNDEESKKFIEKFRITDKKIHYYYRFCFNCGQELISETDLDCRTMWHEKCTKCNYKY